MAQANFIVWGGIAGGIFFHEFAHLHCGPADWGGWIFYILGLSLVVYGLYMVRPDMDDGDDAGGGGGDGMMKASSSKELSAYPSQDLPPASSPAVVDAVVEMLPKGWQEGGGSDDAATELQLSPHCSPSCSPASHVSQPTVTEM